MPCAKIMALDSNSAALTPSKHRSTTDVTMKTVSMMIRIATIVPWVCMRYDFQKRRARV